MTAVHAALQRQACVRCTQYCSAAHTDTEIQTDRWLWLAPKARNTNVSVCTYGNEEANLSNTDRLFGCCITYGILVLSWQRTSHCQGCAHSAITYTYMYQLIRYHMPKVYMHVQNFGDSRFVVIGLEILGLAKCLNCPCSSFSEHRIFGR